MDDFCDRPVHSTDAATEEELASVFGLSVEPTAVPISGRFPLSHHPAAYLVHHHMRNLIQHFEDKVPKHVFRSQFDNWVITFGIDPVERALAVMGRNMDGKKMKRKVA